MKINKKAFTLVELLVVVLIIGILAAIAVPQYQFAVLKSRYYSLMNMAKAIKDAQEVYFLQNGKYAEHFSELDVSVSNKIRVGEYEVILVDGTPSGKNYETLFFDDLGYIIIPNYENHQVMTIMRKNNENYMEYNLSLNDSTVWGGARALCVSLTPAGNLGQKVCNEITRAPESCYLNPTSQRYSCRIYQ